MFSTDAFLKNIFNLQWFESMAVQSVDIEGWSMYVCVFIWDFIYIYTHVYMKLYIYTHVYMKLYNINNIIYEL
jgi:hypothetical protein